MVYLKPAFWPTLPRCPAVLGTHCENSFSLYSNVCTLGDYMMRPPHQLIQDVTDATWNLACLFVCLFCVGVTPQYKHTSWRGPKGAYPFSIKKIRNNKNPKTSVMRKWILFFLCFLEKMKTVSASSSMLPNNFWKINDEVKQYGLIFLPEFN